MCPAPGPAARSPHRLEAGLDTISYSPAEPHAWGNPDDEAPATALFFGMPAEY